ncbi:response regulator [Thalassotalea marina]|uniref:Sensory/regulatory protein RpfC n=1 Tax=Thalassotalea marina TaxID=1673741 RepID=A0A919BJG3_9GAMM|nr:response regulator [Thalassotalea marina]GHF93301.1 hypothetical protein GCM10017161_22010 [Thalassotalea marina]
MKLVTRPLALKMAIFGFAYVMVSSVLFGLIFYIESKDAVVDQEIQKLKLEADIIKPLVTDFYQQSAKDISFLAASQSAKSLYQEQNQNHEQVIVNENSLANLMYELIKNHHYYNKISFLEIKDDVNVQVSVVRNNEHIKIVSKQDLPQHIELEALKPLLSANSKQAVFFSNIEFGQINLAGNEQASFFAALPLYDRQNVLSAIIAVEINLTAYLSAIKSSVLKNIAFYLATPAGEIFFPEKQTGTPLQLLLSKEVSESTISQGEARIIDDYSSVKNNASFAYYSALSVEAFPELPSLYLMIENQNQQFLNAIKKMQLRTAMLSMFVSLFSILVFVLIARRFVKPIKQITKSIISFDKTQRLGQLPTQLNDEIGILARSFKSLLDNLSTSYLEERKAKISATSLSAKLESILDSIADAVITIDDNGVIQAFNKAAVDIFCYDETEIIGKDIQVLIPASHLNLSEVKNMKSSNRIVKELFGAPRELYAVRKGGQSFPILINISQVDTEEGKLYTGLIRDITPLKAIEEEKKRVLQDAKTAAWRLNFALSAPNIGVWDIDLVTNEIKCDERIYKLFGTEPISGLPPRTQWRNLVHPDDLPGIEKEFNNLIKHRRESQFQHRIYLPTGEIRHLEAHAQIIYSDEGVKTRIVGTYRDITEQVQVQELKQQALDMAEASLKLKSDFLASMSHEIRTPMNGVIGMLGLLEQSKLTKQQQHHVFLASSSANSLLSLINDILDFSKIEAGKLDLETVEFDLRNQLSEFAESIALKAQQKKVELVLDVTELKHVMVLGDPGRLRQIMTNLVGNAIKFTEAGEIVIKAGVDHKNNQVIFKCSISDTGIGIPQHKINTLFDSFTQVDASTTRKYGGTGLGLAIVKQLCELMNGDISVSSEEGKGSRFSFNLVFEQSDSKPLSIPNIDISGSNILIVDDNDTNLTVLSCQLKMWGAKVYTATNAEQALETLKQKKERFFDAAILDMQMPNMNGATLGQKIKSNQETHYLPLILMTSISVKGDTEYFEKLGFAAYFSKPATTSDLFDTLSLVLDTNNMHSSQSSIITHSKLMGVHNNKVVSQMPNIARIMVVEDNRINQVVLLGILQNLGLTADVAGNGKEAIELLANCPLDAKYQLLIMDCQMPEMDGYEATKAIRAGQAGDQFVDIPIIAMTANAMKGDEDKCLKAGMSDYATKPINPDILQDKLCHWLGVRDFNGNKDTAALETKDTLASNSQPIQLSKQHWDKSAFYQRIRQNDALANRLIDIYLADMPELFEQLELAIEQVDHMLIKDLAHRIKGSSRNIAVNTVALYAEEIEQNVMNLDKTALLKVYSQIEESFGVAKDELSKNSVY